MLIQFTVTDHEKQRAMLTLLGLLIYAAFPPATSPWCKDEELVSKLQRHTREQEPF